MFAAFTWSTGDVARNRPHNRDSQKARDRAPRSSDAKSWRECRLRTSDRNSCARRRRALRPSSCVCDGRGATKMPRKGDSSHRRSECVRTRQPQMAKTNEAAGSKNKPRLDKSGASNGARYQICAHASPKQTATRRAAHSHNQHPARARAANLQTMRAAIQRVAATTSTSTKAASARHAKFARARAPTVDESFSPCVLLSTDAARFSSARSLAAAN